MSFLSKLNDSKNAATTGAAKPANPFAKNPFAKGNNPFAKKVVKAETVKEKPVAEEVRDGRAPQEPATPVAANTPAPAKETEAEKLAKDLLSGKKKPEPIKGQEEAEDEAQEEPVVQTPEKKFEQEADAAVKAAAEDVSEETEIEAADEGEAETAETETTEAKTEEEAPKKKGTRRRKTKKADEKAEEAKAEEKAVTTVESAPAKLEKKTDSQRVLQVAHYKPVDLLGQKMTYDEARQLVLAQFNDTNAWRQYEDDVLTQLDSKDLRIEADMNPGTLKVVECNLDALATDLLREYIQTKQLHELLTNKDFGAAYALMAEYSDGKNIIDRQQCGFRALASADFGGSKVNVLALIATTRMHLTFLQAVMDRIKSKQNMCITMSSAIKVENSMSMMGAQG